ncbi:MAG: hypothetical protein OEN22_09670, partial [Gammaproteobacteria bacterium]|nr:hypothetical protein [Gammaproteobacteria bacterium]
MKISYRISKSSKAAFAHNETILTIATADALMIDFDLETKYRDYGRKYPSSYGNHRFQDWIDEVVMSPQTSKIRYGTRSQSAGIRTRWGKI